MVRFTDVELNQLDQLLKEMNSENTHRLSDVTWNVLCSFSYPYGLVNKVFYEDPLKINALSKNISQSIN